MTGISQSPYRRAIGRHFSQLHPVLQQYFSAIPAGHVGLGEGVFTRVGTPRRWLWPLLRPLQQHGVIYAGWAEHVPFRIENRTIASRALAEREFHLPHGTWTMRDAVALGRYGRVVDELGEPGIVVASFNIAVDDGALSLTSHRVGLRLGNLRVRVPRFVSPVVRLTERFDDERAQQHIALTITAPLFGLIYEYDGWFTYRIEKERT